MIIIAHIYLKTGSSFTYILTNIMELTLYLTLTLDIKSP